MSVVEEGVRAWLEDQRSWAEEELERHMPAETAHPELLHRAMAYAVFGGGKRLRPALVRLLCRECGGSDEQASRPAVAIELVHTYSLVHDDLPSMDDDELRRGRPTCHVAFDEATAILTGDALLTLAFEVLGAAPAQAGELCGILARAAGSGGMVGGQVIDLNLDEAQLHPERRLATISDLHFRKTALLFGAAAELGAAAAGASRERRRAAGDYGRALGLCFQATDDVLDVTGGAATLGKTPGKDAALERPTLVAALGVEGARAKARELAERALTASRELGWSSDHRGPQLVEFVLERTH